MIGLFLYIPVAILMLLTWISASTGCTTLQIKLLTEQNQYVGRLLKPHLLLQNTLKLIYSELETHNFSGGTTPEPPLKGRGGPVVNL